MTNVFLQYTYLQLLDLLTTVAFLIHGIREGNPIVRLAIDYSPNPISGLVAVKIGAVLLGIYCWRSEKMPLLGRVNIFFAVLVAWNMVSLILGSVFRGGMV